MPRATRHPRLLFVARQFFEEGVRFARIGDDFSSMRAVIFLDLAVEQLLNILIADLDPEAAPDKEELTWPQLWQAATKALATASISRKLPHHRELRSLRRVRNLVQHQGVAPSPSECPGFVEATRQLMRTSFGEVYGLDFESFDLSDHVRNPDLRQLLKDSHLALERPDALVALVGAIMCFRSVVSSLEYAVFGESARRSFTGFSNRIDLPYHSRSAGLEEVATQASRLISELEETINRDLAVVRERAVLALLGASLPETDRFRRATEGLSVQASAAGTWKVLIVKSSPADSLNEVRFALGYVTGLAVTAQDAFPGALDQIRIPIPLSMQPIWNRTMENSTETDTGQEAGNKLSDTYPAGAVDGEQAS